MQTISGYFGDKSLDGVLNWQTLSKDFHLEYEAEIYNHRELAAQLNLATDAPLDEILIAAWRKWDTDFPAHLDGVWALALYDRAAQKLFCSRDRFGEKTFYYTTQNGVFAWANSLHRLRKIHSLNFNLAPLAVQKYFAYGFVPAPHTIFQDVYKLPAGHNLIYDVATAKFTCRQFYDFQFATAAATPNENELAEELLTTLTRAVKKRLTYQTAGDDQVGVLLSGGVDSSAVAALTAQLSPHPLTFSLGFAERTYDESPYAAQVAALIGARHQLTLLTDNEMAINTLSLLAQLDEPFADDSILPTFLIYRAAREKVRFALGGDGGDEMFGGYEPLRFWQWARRFKIYLPKFLQRALIAGARALPVTTNYLPLGLKLKRFFRASQYKLNVWLPSLSAPLTGAEISELLNTPTPLEEIYREAITIYEHCASAHPLDRLTMYYVKLSLPDLMLAKTTNAARLNDLTLRSPFLDQDVAALAQRLPPSWRVNNGLLGAGTTKYLLKKSLAKILPPEILYRAKQGFSPPSWWHRAESPFATRVVDNAARTITPAFITRALSAHTHKQTDHKLYLWAQLVLNEFLQPAR